MSEFQTDILLDFRNWYWMYWMYWVCLNPQPGAPNHQGLNRVESPRAQRLVLKLLKKQAQQGAQCCCFDVWV
jgi:hypothetical protein